MSLTLYTQNCFGLPIAKKRLRFRKIARHIEENDYDLACLQEVVFKRDLRFIASLNPKYHILYDPGKVFVKGGLVTLVKRSIANEFSVKYTPFRKQGSLLTVQIFERPFWLKGFLEVRIPEHNILLVNAHTSSSYMKEFRHKVDKVLHHQIRQLFSVMTQETIICGDLNFSEYCPIYSELLKNGITDHALGLKSWLDRRFDYILSLATTIGDVENPVYPSFVSDHKGLRAVVEV